MMEASGAGGTAIAIVVGIFEPGAVVELYHVESANVLRAEGGERVGRRVVDRDAIVGFDGLIDGDHYFATGYSGGRYEERRLVAHEPDEAADQIQPAPQSAPVTLGVDQTPVDEVASAEVATSEPPAPAEGEQPLEEGLPAGVADPVLPPAPDSSPSPEPAQTTEQTVEAGDGVKVEAGGTPTDTQPVGQGEPAPADPTPPQEAPATAAVDAAEAAADAPPADDTPSVEAPAPADAPAADAQAQPQGESPAVADAPAEAPQDPAV